MLQMTLGEQELELLRYLAERGPATVGEVTEGFGKERSLARSTVKTMMERLEKKGYLACERGEGVFRYHTAVPQQELLTGLVRRFVERTLAGSVSPFVTYMAEGKEVSDAEFAELQQLVEHLQSKRKGGQE